MKNPMQVMTYRSSHVPLTHSESEPGNYVCKLEKLHLFIF